MQFDFTLNPNGAQKLDVSGKFFKLVSGTGKVRVTSDTGESIELLPGQGVWNTKFNWLTVTDRTGANNAGTILAGNFDFHDDRISGTVDVVDGGKARTIANQAFMQTTISAAVANTYSMCQLWNPPGSGKNVVVEQLVCSTTGQAANGICVRFNTAQLANPQGLINGVSKKAGATTVSVGMTCNDQETPPPGTTSNSFLVINAAQKSFKFTEPLVLPPGTGLFLFNLTAAESLTTTFEWFEEVLQ